jgi:hypothetical protein
VLRSRPDFRLPNTAQESWNDVVEERFPFNSRPVISDRENEGSMGASITIPGRPDLRYSIYFSMENPENEENIQKRFTAFRDGIRLRN